MARPTITQRVARAAAGTAAAPIATSPITPLDIATAIPDTSTPITPLATATAIPDTSTAAGGNLGIPIISGAILETEDDVEFEEAEEMYLSLGESATLFASRIRNIDESGFIIGDPVLFRPGLRTAALFAFTTSDRRMSIVETRFAADLFDDEDLLQDTQISDYATLYDGVDVSVSQVNGSVNYDESERAGLEMKFWRINSTNAVYRNLLNTEFAFSNPIEPPVVQMTNPEQITTELFSSLSETAESSNEIEVSEVPEGFERFRSSPQFSAPTSGTGPGSYS